MHIPVEVWWDVFLRSMLKVLLRLRCVCLCVCLSVSVVQQVWREAQGGCSNKLLGDVRPLTCGLHFSLQSLRYVNLCRAEGLSKEP